ncbi:response regulator [Rhabdochromatium marinum]|uniref:response regulator n=1 Tax=Rhabdochromatium marinum TaxID=48729 RepID=UPI001906C6D2|nr:response regulator [Rhabdochromatium marinum]MBK1650068.1 response regulator [Rhabdochromatium marinum]
MSEHSPVIDSQGQPRPIEILLVEDNPADIRLTREALKDSKTLNNLHVAMDGLEALAYLQCEGEHAQRPRPDLVLLDLNLPRMDGRELLREMKSHEHLRQIPVVVLTTSAAEEDILRSYQLHANCYIRKPVDFANFIKVVQGIEGFWFSIVTLPSS